MTGSMNSDELDKKSGSGEDSEEDESEILEESPCGRWSKRRQEVQQRDVPGIEAAYLAMDTEEGMEVVWNEVRISERRNVKDQDRKIEEVFENLTQLDHPNIVKLHKYWTDTKGENRRVVFITEYMSSGSLKKFLKLTKRNVKKLPLQSWKRWCSQILSALSYLHSCSPPIIHGNLTTESIFIQHNGLVKIGSVAPDAIETHVKTYHGEIKNTHFIAPEYGDQSPVTPAADIYSFGMAALEMAALEIPGNGDSGIKITRDLIKKTIDSLENELQKDFIQQCLDLDPVNRSVSSKLLFHPSLFEVHSLKLLSAHSIVHSSKQKHMDSQLEKMAQRVSQDDFVVAEIKNKITIMRSDIVDAEKLANFIEEVRLNYPKYSIYPLTTEKLPPPVLRRRPLSPEVEATSSVSAANEPATEIRKIVNMMCTIRVLEVGKGFSMTLSLRMEDKMNRQLTCNIERKDGPGALADELVQHGFINEIDREKVAATIQAEMGRVRFGVPMTEMNGDIHSLNFATTCPTMVTSSSR